jgi:hypothetical protein
MPDVERGGATRYPLAAEVIELPRGAQLGARTWDISSTRCHIDTLNPIPQGSLVAYVSCGLAMGFAFIG